MLDSESLTRTGDVIGTAAYMAPEQAQGLPAGTAADLFSIALVLYEALSGVNPLRTVSGNRHGRGGTCLPALRRQRRELPRELGQAIDLALRPRAMERGTLAELRTALVSAVGSVGDEPGVVDASVPERTLTRPGGAEGPGVQAPIAPKGAGRREPRAASATPWPRRALAALATAALTTWLARRVPGAAPLPAPLLACLAAALVAALPRLGWLIATAALAGSLVAHSRPGGALLILVGGLVPAALAPGDGPIWPLAVAAPALNLVGLATAWPALAGFAGTARRRAVLAATGWLWLALTHPAQGQGLSSVTTLHDAIEHVIRPLVTIGTPATCAVWAAAALVLPVVRIRRSPELEYIRTAAWATALALATIATQSLGGGPSLSLGTALLGAYLGGLVAIVTRRIEGRIKTHRNGERLGPERVA